MLVLILLLLVVLVVKYIYRKTADTSNTGGFSLGIDEELRQLDLVIFNLKRRLENKIEEEDYRAAYLALERLKLLTEKRNRLQEDLSIDKKAYLTLETD